MADHCFLAQILNGECFSVPGSVVGAQNAAAHKHAFFIREGFAEK